ncbi:MAG: hypothetical protein J0M24_13565 [Verrucomicrobia bacterium]|nr:hypothetical protein [Verrucomicrobiota bacterium]
MGFKLTYELQGAGWALARIRDKDEHLDVAVSYLRDSLRELAEAARALAAGAEFARVVFMDEPGEIQLLLNRTDNGLSYEARRFDDWNSWGMGAPDRFEVVFSGVTTVQRFVGEVTSQLESLMQQYGASGYQERWVNRDFPEDLLAQLRALGKAD